MSPHRPAGRFVGENAISVVLNVRNVVKRAQQCARIKNSDDPIRTVAAAVLYHAGFDGGDAPIVLHAGLEINDRPGASAMRPENFLSRVGNLHRLAGGASSDPSNNFHGNHFTLAAKTTAHQRLDHPDL